MHASLWAIFAMAAVSPPHLVAKAQAIATIRVLHATVVTKDAWESGKDGQRREVRKRDEMGRVLILRLIEHE
jgi:hypothetical protein